MTNTAEKQERPYFDPANVDAGIRAACSEFDRLGLTLFERLHAAYSISTAAASGLGIDFSEYRRMVGEMGTPGGQ